MKLFTKIQAFIVCVIATVSFSMMACQTSGDNSSANSATKPYDSSIITPDKPQNDIKNIKFVSINDLHGYIEQDENGKNGLANTAYLINSLSAYFNDNDPETDVRDDLVLFANGDMFQGTALSNMSKGRAVIDAMNLMHFDGMGIGNHEFDWGLESIYTYFDGDEQNGEATFPLISSNIMQKSQNNSYIADLSDTDNILPYSIVEKSGVKVGLISVIGPLKNSILASKVADYDFLEVDTSVKTTAKLLKAEGAELISVNIHCGNAESPLYYPSNLNIANMKDDDGNYLVDVIFNGHTHTRNQAECIKRTGGTDVPVIQAGGNNYQVGVATIAYNTKDQTTSVKGCETVNVKTVGTKADEDVKNSIKNSSNNLTNTLPTLAVSSLTLKNRYAIEDYVANIMIKSFNADFSLSNSGGLRGTGSITANQPIKESNLYEIIPFDNVVYYVTISAKALYNFYVTDGGSHYYYDTSGKSFESLQDDDGYYTLAIIDYVYEGEYFAECRKSVTSAVKTNLELRELLKRDVEKQGELGLKWTYENGSYLEVQEWVEFE